MRRACAVCRCGGGVSRWVVVPTRGRRVGAGAVRRRRHRGRMVERADSSFLCVRRLVSVFFFFLPKKAGWNCVSPPPPALARHDRHTRLLPRGGGPGRSPSTVDGDRFDATPSPPEFWLTRRCCVWSPALPLWALAFAVSTKPASRRERGWWAGGGGRAGVGSAVGAVGDAHRVGPRCVLILPPEHSGFPPPPLGSHPASALTHGVSASTSLCLWAACQGRWASRVQGILQDGGDDVARTPFSHARRAGCGSPCRHFVSCSALDGGGSTGGAGWVGRPPPPPGPARRPWRARWGCFPTGSPSPCACRRLTVVLPGGWGGEGVGGWWGGVGGCGAGVDRVRVRGDRPGGGWVQG